MQQKAHDPRIDKLYAGDRNWAYLALIVLWILYGFVFYQVTLFTTDSNVYLALAISGALVLIFNAAAVYAMISHYAEDRERIYGLDLFYRDMNKKRG